jgi:hypothetical protein
MEGAHIISTMHTMHTLAAAAAAAAAAAVMPNTFTFMYRAEAGHQNPYFAAPPKPTDPSGLTYTPPSELHNQTLPRTARHPFSMQLP